jgi:uncharacterized repeat protein (TIGR03803 family)
LMFCCHTPAQTFKTLHDFTAGSDGGSPQAGLILSSNTLYGTAYGGGSSGSGTGSGTVFALNTDGTSFGTLYRFTAGSDGAFPSGRLLLWGNTLYGTAQTGGGSRQGTVFALSADGTGFTTLHSFTLYRKLLQRIRQ